MKTLNEIAIGKKCKVKKLICEGKFKKRLLDMGVTPSAKIIVKKKAPLGDPIEIAIRGYELSLRKDECKLILVEEVLIWNILLL